MASAGKGKGKGPAESWTDISGDLNLWEPTEKGDSITGLITSVNPAGPYGLQIKLMVEDGTVFTLPSHKVLQGRLESALPKLIPGTTVLQVVYEGEEKGKKWPTPMRMYSARFRPVESSDTFAAAAH